MHGIARARIERMIAPVVRQWLLYKTSKENKWRFYPRDFPEFPPQDLPIGACVEVTIRMVDNPFIEDDK